MPMTAFEVNNATSWSGQNSGTSTSLFTHAMSDPRAYPDRPFLAVSAAIVRDGRVLIVRRARSPALGVFTLPGGVVETDALAAFPNREEMLAAGAANPVGRLVTSDDIAGAVAFLCSADASMVRGQTLIVDGGFSLLVGGGRNAQA